LDTSDQVEGFIWARVTDVTATVTPTSVDQ